jgi:putative glutamine amidotransferase
LIGVTGRRYPATALAGPELHTVLASLQIDGFHASYMEKLAEAGAVPVYITRESDPAVLIARLDGLVLAGGIDVDPRLYGGTLTAHSTLLDPPQDAFEIALARRAVERGIPVLGTCRGHELLNVAFGGSLVHHLEGLSGPRHRRIMYPMTDPGHPIHVREGSTLHRLYGATAEVNSFHHQAVDRLGQGLQATAVAEDDVVEAIELEDADVIGVQWHPEFSPGVEPLFNWLVEQAGGVAADPDGSVLEDLRLANRDET